MSDLANKIDFSKIREIPRNRGANWILHVGLKILLALIALYILINVAALLLSVGEVRAVAGNLLSARADLEQAALQAKNRDFEEAHTLVVTAHDKVESAREAFAKIPLVRHIPVVSHPYTNGDRVLEAGALGLEAGEVYTALIRDIAGGIRNETLIFSELSERHRREIMGMIVDVRPRLEQAQTNINEADKLIRDVSGLYTWISPLNDIADSMPLVAETVNTGMRFLEVAPTVLGFEDQVTYLFLLQNNNELRPTGGFIGTYGRLVVNAGEVVSFETDNVYNLDRAFESVGEYETPQEQLAIDSPDPLATYLEQEHWSLRDANWDPDFPSTAEQVIDFYQLESAVASDLARRYHLEQGNPGSTFKDPYISGGVDGVFAVTPELIEDLLALTGPVAVQGTRFSSENFQEELEFKVGTEFKIAGIETAARKQIINELYLQIMARLRALPVSNLVDVLQIVTDSLQKKAVLIYHRNPAVQQRIVESGWSGAIENVDHDYLMVVDANLGSLKTDQHIDRDITYSINRENGSYVATVEIEYDHTGEFNYNTTRYRTYTRVYAPWGSQLISVEGSLKNDLTKNESGQAGEADVNDEHNKTVFGAFTSVEPLSTGRLVFRYQLPDRIAQQIKNAEYMLLVQKQPGVSPELTLRLNFGKTDETRVLDRDILIR